MDLAERIKKAGKVMLIGNGGSYANAMHIANDLLSCGIPAYTMDVATFSAFANDFGYYTAFEKWVQVCGRKGDMLIALSGSGKSPNNTAPSASADGPENQRGSPKNGAPRYGSVMS